MESRLSAIMKDPKTAFEQYNMLPQDRDALILKVHISNVEMYY